MFSTATPVVLVSFLINPNVPADILLFHLWESTHVGGVTQPVPTLHTAHCVSTFNHLILFQLTSGMNRGTCL